VTQIVYKTLNFISEFHTAARPERFNKCI